MVEIARNRACLLILACCISACKRDVQLFEGVIHYKHTLESCSPDYTYEQMVMNFGTESTYYYSKGNYKWVFGDAMYQEELYLKDEGRLYFLFGQDVFYADGKLQDEDILEYSLRKNQLGILGKDCDMLSLITLKRNNQKVHARYIYFTPEIVIADSAFSELRYFSHDFIAENTRSVPLKIILNTEDFTATWEAESVQFAELSDSTFYIPGMEDALPVDLLSY